MVFPLKGPQKSDLFHLKGPPVFTGALEVILNRTLEGILRGPLYNYMEIMPYNFSLFFIIFSRKFISSI